MHNITSEKSPLFQPVSLFFPLLGTRFSRRKVGRLIGDQQARNTRTRQGTQRARNQCRDCQSAHITATPGGDLREHPNLSTEGTNVGKAAEGVGGDEAGAGREVGVGWVSLESGVGDEFIL